MKYKGKGFVDKLFAGYIRNIPDHPSKRRIVNYINDFVFGGRVKMQAPNNSVYNVSTRDYMGAQVIYKGAYEPLSLLISEAIMQNGGVFIDVGANMGLFSIYLSAIKNIKIYSIEPSADNFQKLLFNIKCNQAKNITPINTGLSYKNSFGYLGTAVTGNSGTVQVDDTPGNDQSYLISLTTLAAIVEYLQVKEIDLLKIDVEGFEMNVFNGYFPFSSIMPKNIIMEFSDYMSRTGYTMQDCYEYFIRLGYKPYDVNGAEYHLNQYLPEANLWWKLK